MESWKTLNNSESIDKSRVKFPEVRSFGEAWGIAHGLRFGSAVAKSGFDDGGEAREIWSPVTQHVMDAWHEYRNCLEGQSLGVKQFSPDYIQIDDREWSLGFSIAGNFPIARVNDFCLYLASIGLRKRNLFFDIWSESVEGLDDQITTRVGLTAQSRYMHFNEYEHFDLESPPICDLPLAHTATGQIVHLKKRAFEICKFCNVAGTVWCNPEQVLALERFQEGVNEGFLDHFSVWDYVTFALGLHQGCIKQALTKREIQNLRRLTLDELAPSVAVD